MASVIQVNGKWRALVRRKGHKAKCKTFATKSAADAWARARESEIDRGEDQATHTFSVKDVIDAYRKLREDTRPIRDDSNEHYMLKALTAGLGHHVASKLTPDDLVAYATMRREDGAGPYTINMDLSKLGTIYRFGGAKLKVAFPDAVGAARPTLSYLRLIGGGGKRERRPTEDELFRIIELFKERHGQGLADAVEFAAVTAMRRGEVAALKWSDLNEQTKMIEVMRKHPRKGKVLERVPLLGRAWELAQRQPKDGDLIFPWSGQTLSKYFHEACVTLKIPDLRFHDLRHEGTSALFEAGYTIEQVALVTGHKSWSNLKRYTNLKPEDLHKVK